MPRPWNEKPGGYFVPAENVGPRPGDYPVGSLESRAAARAMLAGYAEEQRKTEAALLEGLPPVAKVTIEDIDNPNVRILTLRLHHVAVNKDMVYDIKTPWPTVKEFRHKQAVNKEIDRMTGGQEFAICMRDMKEWHRLEAIAEENLRARKK